MKVCSAVDGVARLGGFGAPWFFFPVAHCIELLLVHTQHGEGASHGLGPLLAQCEVVFRGSTVVGVSLDEQAGPHIGFHEAGSLLDHGNIFLPNRRSIEFEENGGTPFCVIARRL